MPLCSSAGSAPLCLDPTGSNWILGSPDGTLSRTGLNFVHDMNPSTAAAVDRPTILLTRNTMIWDNDDLGGERSHAGWVHTHLIHSPLALADCRVCFVEVAARPVSLV